MPSTKRLIISLVVACISGALGGYVAKKTTDYVMICGK